MYDEVLYANQEFEPDLQPNDVDRHVRALGDICLLFLNTNEFQRPQITISNFTRTIIPGTLRQRKASIVRILTVEKI